MKTKKVLGQKGQSSVEYLLIVAVLVGAIFVFGKQLRSGFEKVTAAVFNNLSEKVTTKIQNPD